MAPQMGAVKKCVAKALVTGRYRSLRVISRGGHEKGLPAIVNL